MIGRILHNSIETIRSRYFGKQRQKAMILLKFMLILNLSLVGIMSLSLIYEMLAMTVLSGLLILVTVFSMVRLIQGNLESTVFYLSTIFTLASCVACLIGFGMRDSIMITFPVIVMIASLTLRLKGLLFILILTISCIALIALGEMANWFVPTPPKGGALVESIIVLIVCSIGMTLANMVVKNIKHLISRAKKELKECEVLEKQLRQEDEYKLELLKEIHHRVKNNLSFASALIALEEIKETESLNLADLQEKIIDIGRATDPIFRGKDYEIVDLVTYLKELHELASDRYGFKGSLTVEVSSIDVKKAAPLGIIITEMVSLAKKFNHLVNFELKQDDRILRLFIYVPEKLDEYLTFPSVEIALINVMIEELQATQRRKENCLSICIAA